MHIVDFEHSHIQEATEIALLDLQCKGNKEYKKGPVP